MDYAAEIAAWRARRVARLTSETGWLSLADLVWLEEGGNATAAGIFDVRGRSATFSPGPGLAVTLDGRPVTEPITVASDAVPEPTRLDLGTRQFELLERGGRLAVRVRDSQSAARQRFRGVEAFPVDPAWRLEARFEPYDPPKRIPMPSVVNTVEQEISPGAVVFEIAGVTHRLDPILERGETDYWVVFGDRTNGVETYGAGRFVYVPPPVTGRTVLDFNKAYNPPCAFTPYSTCPLPPPQNRLPIRVEAGEKVYL
jgi:hypothetical protein